MKNTKSNFECTAAIINAARTGVPATQIADLASGYFAVDNPRFDKDKFMAACGFGNETKGLGKLKSVLQRKAQEWNNR